MPLISPSRKLSRIRVTFLGNLLFLKIISIVCIYSISCMCRNAHDLACDKIKFKEE